MLHSAKQAALEDACFAAAVCAGSTPGDPCDARRRLDKNHAYILVTTSKYPMGALRGELTKES